MGSPQRSNLAFGMLVSFLVTALGVGVFGVASIRSSMAPASAAPQFFDWAAPGPIDGRFLVTFESEATTVDGRLIEDDGTLYVNLDVSSVDSAGVDEIQDAIGESIIATTDATLAGLVADPRVDTVDPIGFDTYVVVGDLTTEDLESLPGVARAVPDVGLAGASADELFPLQWPLENTGATMNFETVPDADIDGPLAWHRARGAGVTVAVLDSGVDVAHPDLVHALWTNPGETCGNGIDDEGNGYIDDCTGWNFGDGNADVSDHVGHGTHVAGIIAAEADNGIGVAGAAYEASIMPLKIGDETPTLSAAIEAIAYAIGNGARIINASWVTPDPSAEAILQRAIAAAEKAGVLVVVGAGNDASDLGDHPVYPAALDGPNLVTVAASSAVDRLAMFTNTGSSVDIAAPGEHIISTIPNGYGVFSGTSMAAPHVSAAAALLWSAEPAVGYDEVLSAILDRADRPPAIVGSIGGGRLDVGAAVEVRRFRPSLGFTFIGFDALVPDEVQAVSIRAELTDPWAVPPQTPARYRVSVLAAGSEGPMAVGGLDIGTADGAVTTDATGRAFVGESFVRSSRSALVRGEEVTDLSLELPAGTYALVYELMDVSDPADPVTLGDPSAVFFSIGLGEHAMPVPVIGTSQPLDPGPDQSGEPAPEDPVSAPGVQDAATGDTSPASQDSGGGSAAEGSDPAQLSPGAGGTDRGPIGTENGNEGVPSAGTADESEVEESGDGGVGIDEAPPPAIDDQPADGPASAPGSGEVADDDAGDGEFDGQQSPGAGADSLHLVRVNPATGTTLGGTTVTIVGDIPAQPLVEFGSGAARVVAVGEGYVVVETRPHPAGRVDVVVSDSGTGLRGVLTGAFTYVEEVSGDESSDQGSSEPEVDPIVGDPGPGGDAPSTTVDGGVDQDPGDGSGVSSPSPVADDPVASPPLTPPEGSAGLPQAEEGGIGSAIGYDDWFNSVVVSPSDLDLVPLAADDPLRSIDLAMMAGQHCSEPECPGWVLAPGVHHATDPRTRDHQHGSGKVDRATTRKP